MLEEIFYILIEKENSVADINLWEVSYTNICKKLFLEENSDISFITIDSICRIFEKAGYSKKNILIKIWDNIYRNFYKEICNIKCNDILNNYVIEKLHRYLYLNLIFQENDQKNNFSLDKFSSDIYFYFIKDNKSLDNQKQLGRLKNDLYDNIIMFIDYTFKNLNYKIITAYNELCNYTKTLIDNNEYEILKEQFTKLLGKHTWNVEEAKYIFITIIYLYYIALKENLVNADQKVFANKLFEELKNDLSAFMIMYDINSINVEFIENITNRISGWEVLPIKGAKFLFLDKVIEEFFLFYILANQNDINELIKDLNSLITDREFIFYDTYAGKNKEKTIKKYEKFLSLFYSRGNNQENSIETIEKFESALIYIYKITEIRKSKQVSDFEIERLKFNIRTSITSDLENKIKVFNNKRPKKILNFSQEILRVITYTVHLNDENEYIRKNMSISLVEVIKHLIDKKVTYKEIFYNNKEMLNEFFLLVESSDIQVDTLVGYRNYFYGMERQEDFKILESKMNQIKVDGINNIVLAIDSSSFFLNLIDVEVRIDKLTEEEMLQDATLNDEGKYLHNITNDIYLPFEKEELIEYLSSAKRIIKISLNLEYGFNCNEIVSNIGVGIKIKNI